MVSRYGGLFLNGGIGDLVSQNLNLDAPVYPLAAPGLSGRLRPRPWLTARGSAPTPPTPAATSPAITASDGRSAQMPAARSSPRSPSTEGRLRGRTRWAASTAPQLGTGSGSAVARLALRPLPDGGPGARRPARRASPCSPRSHASLEARKPLRNDPVKVNARCGGGAGFGCSDRVPTTRWGLAVSLVRFQQRLSGNVPARRSVGGRLSSSSTTSSRSPRGW